MSGTLLMAVSIGPVQDFIAQARRTRDLWFGSHLLSELGRAAATALIDGGGLLVFPALDPGSPQLSPTLGPFDEQGEPAFAVPNKLLAYFPEGTTAADVSQVAQLVRRSIDQRWWQLAEEVRTDRRVVELLASEVASAEESARGRSPSSKAPVSVWSEQVGSLIESYVAWTAFDGDDPGGYTKARSDLDRAISMRKTLRQFGQDVHGRPGAPKSSLDGGRVSVLGRARDTLNARSKFRIGRQEHLDAVGVIKRCGGKPEQFLPVANVSLAPWIAWRRGKRGGDLLDRLQQDPRAQKFGRVVLPTPAGRALTVDAQCLLEDRLPTLFEESTGERDPAAVREFTREFVHPLLRRLPDGGRPPHPYVAVLMADGDRMGEALGALEQFKDQRRLSDRLSSFAARAREIVELAMGSLVYAGGDDVLAFVPLATALGCAQELRAEFARIMEDALTNHPDAPRPTLSVGLGVGHLMVGMGELLDLGRSAERLAKGDHLADVRRRRNALGILLSKRSGGTVGWRCNWPVSDGPAPLDSAARLLISGDLPVTKLYQVRRSMRGLPPADAVTSTASTWLRLLQEDVRRTLARSRGGGSSVASLADFDLSALAGAKDYASGLAAVDEWVAAILVAKEFINGGAAGFEKREGGEDV